MGESYRFARPHVVERNGKSATFRSYNKPGFWLELEAADEARKAGLYDEPSGRDEVLLDGKPILQEYR